MRTITVNVYTLAELNTQFPQVYAKLLSKWKTAVRDSGDIPFIEDTMQSLKEVVKTFGATLDDWSIGTDYDHSYVRISLADNETYITDKEAVDSQLTALGYVPGEFPGLCKLTGYCADEDFLEHVYKSVRAGGSLRAALKGLGKVASKMLQDNLDQQCSEESMQSNWEDTEFDETGREIK